jgi:hypothetical protein
MAYALGVAVLAYTRTLERLVGLLGWPLPWADLPHPPIDVVERAITAARPTDEAFAQAADEIRKRSELA